MLRERVQRLMALNAGTLRWLAARLAARGTLTGAQVEHALRAPPLSQVRTSFRTCEGGERRSTGGGARHSGAAPGFGPGAKVGSEVVQRFFRPGPCHRT
jgi:hypothetical protein